MNKLISFTVYSSILQNHLKLIGKLVSVSLEEQEAKNQHIERLHL